jgi:transcriptional regulator with XRE-family HTH domain
MNATLNAVPKGMPLPSLKRVRLDKSFSQADLAEAADVAVRTVTYAEQGYAVTLRTTRKLSAALGVTPAELRAEPKDNDA